jgi:hypothetical protein
VTPYWLVFAIWGAVLFVILNAWALTLLRFARHARTLRHPRAIENFARANGWSYQERDDSQRRPGPPFTEASGGSCTNVVRGTWRGQDFVALDYDHLAHAVMLKLAARLPRLEVYASDLPGEVPFGVANVRLESEEFTRRFWVHADPPKFASDILTPRLMEHLLSAPPMCWRIWGDDLVGWWPGELTPARIPLTLLVLCTVQDSIPSFVLHEYGFTDGTAREVLPL